MDNDNNAYPLLDITQLEMLLESGDEESLELVKEILELYEQECQVKFKELVSAKANSDVSAFADASHAVAGSSANIGAASLWQKTMAMENHCKTGDPADAFAMLDEIQEEYKESLVQLKSYISSLRTDDS